MVPWDNIIHICGCICSICLLISGIVSFTYGTAWAVIAGLINLVGCFVVAGLEAPELCGNCMPSFLNGFVECFKPPLYRFILYLVLCIGCAGGIGFLALVCNIIMAIFYALQAFAPNVLGSGSSAAAASTV